MKKKDMTRSTTVLWNKQQQRDLYDSRRSLIARSPHHLYDTKEKDLQLVCLMQAAEIQRLNQILLEVKLKFIEGNRIDIDRKSYEIHIKQLTDRIDDNLTLKIQNDKLKEYLRRLSAQLGIKLHTTQELQWLKINYERCLLQLRMLTEKNLDLQVTFKQLTLEKRYLRENLQNVQKVRIVSSSAQKYEIQKNIRKSFQVQTRQLIFSYQSRLRDLQFDKRILTQELQEKNIQIKTLLSRIQGQNKKDISNIEKQVQDPKNIESDSHQKAKELQKANKTLKQKTLQLQNLQINFKSLQEKLDDSELKIKQLNRRILQLQTPNSKNAKQVELQQTINKLKTQIQNRNTFIKDKENEIKQSLLKYSQLQKNYKQLEIERKEQNKQYQSKILSLQAQLKEKQYNNEKNLTQTREIESLKDTIKKKNDQMSKLHEKIKSIQSNQSQIARLKAIMVEHQKTITTLKKGKGQQSSNYQQIINQHLIKIQSYKQNICKLQKQINKINDIVSIKNKEIQTLKTELQKIAKNQNIQTQQCLQEELRKQRQGFKQQISNLELQYKQHIQALNKKCMQLEQKNKILSQNFNNIGHINQIELKNSQINKLSQQIWQLKAKIKILEDKAVELQGKQEKITILNQQISRLNNSIKMKNEQINTLEIKINLYEKQSPDIFSLKNQLTEKDKVISNIQTQFNELKLQLQKKLNLEASLRQRVSELQRLIQKLQAQIVHLQPNTICEQEINQNVQELQNKIALLSHQIQRLQSICQMKDEQISKILSELNNKNISFEQQEGLKSALKQKEQIIIKKTVQIENARRQNEQLESKLQVFERKLRSAEISISNSPKKGDPINQTNKLKQQNIHIHRQLDVKLGQINRLNQFIKIKEKEWNNKNTMVPQLQHRILDLQARLSALSRQKNDILIKKTDLQKRQTIMVAEREGLLRNIQVLHDKIRNLQANNQQILKMQDQNNHQYELRLINLSEQLKRIQFILEKKQQKIRNLEQKLSKPGQATPLSQKTYLYEEKIQTILQDRRKTQQKCIKADLQYTNIRQKFIQLESVYAHTLAQRDHLFKLSHQIQDKLKAASQGRVDKEFTKKLELQIINLTAEIAILKEQNQKLIQQANHPTSQQFQKLKKQILELRTQNQKIKEQYEAKISSIQTSQSIKLSKCLQQITRLNKNLVFQVEENQKLHIVIKKSQNVIKSNEQKIISLSTQLERMTTFVKRQNTMDQNKQKEKIKNQLNIKQGESRQWQKKYSVLQSRFKTMQITQTNIQNQNNNIKRILAEYQNKISRVQSQFDTLNKMIHQVRGENERLKLNNQSKELQDKNMHLSSQIERLNGIITGLKQQISDLRIKLTDQFALQRRIQQFMALMVVLFAQIETLRKRCQQTEQQCENVRRSSLTPYIINKK